MKKFIAALAISSVVSILVHLYLAYDFFNSNPFYQIWNSNDKNVLLVGLLISCFIYGVSMNFINNIKAREEGRAEGMKEAKAELNK